MQFMCIALNQSAGPEEEAAPKSAVPVCTAARQQIKEVITAVRHKP